MKKYIQGSFEIRTYLHLLVYIKLTIPKITSFSECLFDSVSESGHTHKLWSLFFFCISKSHLNRIYTIYWTCGQLYFSSTIFKATYLFHFKLNLSHILLPPPSNLIMYNASTSCLVPAAAGFRGWNVCWTALSLLGLHLFLHQSLIRTFALNQNWRVCMVKFRMQGLAKICPMRE